MDLDIEMGDAADGMPEMLADEPEPRQTEEILQLNDEPQEPGEVAEDGPTIAAGEEGGSESKTVVPNKIHIHGVDTLHTDEIKAYVRSHFGLVDRIEWIDDHSANLVFANNMIAHDALAALSAMEVLDVTALAVGETLPAKPFHGKPEVSFQLRFAVESDKKQAGAALRSRYYLLHPEHDPEERRRKQQQDRARYRDREGSYHSLAGRHRRDGSTDDAEVFEASMYDDAPRSQRSRRGSGSRDATNAHLRSNHNHGKELFGNRSSLRKRSASPRRHLDGGDAHQDELERSNDRNRIEARSIKSGLADNSSKELFPTKSSGRGGQLDQLDQLEESIGSARLRIEDFPNVVITPDSATDDAFKIKGAAADERRNRGRGFAIKGAALGSARELFPDKLGNRNASHDLPSPARTKRRQKAHDLFS
ncbi:uncharacterized protein UV8b_06432 [Ustilaginoidea virens]|uniref:Nucleotide-binding, alpha-beta plait n=1 Tax=Ustilaginoidea virens TaxID=1159556 RepID=A0A8E5MJU8_USTVR|nr:uncharacterized protein UV8b_06432 [Ustilaginoidea virens]QUC22191.1 hypothetical protein UV8b_06432 [Ustilaginoidea virens]